MRRSIPKDYHNKPEKGKILKQLTVLIDDNAWTHIFKQEKYKIW
jgi:hypothetical protein